MIDTTDLNCKSGNIILLFVTAHAFPVRILVRVFSVVLISSMGLSIVTRVLAQETRFVTQTQLGYLAASSNVVVLGDINEDGSIDAVIGNEGQNEIYFNLGKGTFSPEGTPLGGITSDTTSMGVGDLNGDGTLDIVVGNSGQNEIYLNQGRGTFSPVGVPLGDTISTTTSIGIGDLDGNGALDVVVGNFGEVDIYLNQGKGRFPPSGIKLDSDSGPTNIVIGDIDADGLPDIVVRQSNSVAIHFSGDNVDDYKHLPPKKLWTSHLGGWSDGMALGDINGDGLLDIIVGNRLDRNQIFINQDGETFQPVDFGRVDGATTEIAVGDLDGNGLLDIVVANDDLVVSTSDLGPLDHDGQNAVYLNQGKDVLQLQRIPFGDENSLSRSIALGDLDGNGLLDIVVGNDGINSVHMNQEYGQFLSRETLLCDGSFSDKVIAIGDLDGNGSLDIAAGSFQGQNVVYFNQGGGRFSSETAPFGPDDDRTTSIAIGDFDGNGELDIVSGNAGQNAVYLNQGKGKFLAQGNSFGHEAMDADSVAIGDVNMDGQLDIIVEHAVYLNHGGGEFRSKNESFSPKGAPTSVAVGDLDMDGDLDIVVGNIGSFGDGGQNAVYLNQGRGEFLSEGVPFGYGDETHAVAVGDLNADGQLDIVVGNGEIVTLGNVGQNEVFINQGDVTFSPVGQAFGSERDTTEGVTIGDINGDGLHDVVFNNFDGQMPVYLNNGDGTFPTKGVLFGHSHDFNSTGSISAGDIDGDGLFDVVRSVGECIEVHFGQLRRADSNINIWSAISTTGPVDAIEATFPSNTRVLSKPEIRIPFSLFDQQARPVGHVEVQYSLNGGGAWRMAEPVAITETINLTAGYQVRVSQTVSNTLLVSDTQDVDRLELWLSIDHPRLEDLQAALIGPDEARTSVRLFDNVAGAAANSGTLVFDDRAPITATIAISTSDNRYRPEESLLSAFAGKPMTGTWTLVITDTVAGEPVTPNAWGLRIDTPPAEHVFRWDVPGSGFFGRSDNMVIRMIAYPQAPADLPPELAPQPGTFRYYNATAGPILRPYVSATTFPFRVQGLQVRVEDGDAQEQAFRREAQAYRLRAGTNRNAEPFRTGEGVTALSDPLGYVVSPDELYPGDSLAALWPADDLESVVYPHTPERRYLASRPMEIPPGQSVRSTLTISDVRRMGSLELTAGFAITHTDPVSPTEDVAPAVLVADLAFTLTTPYGDEIGLLSSTDGVVPAVRTVVAENLEVSEPLPDTLPYNLSFTPESATIAPLLPEPPEEPLSLDLTARLPVSYSEQLDALVGSMAHGEWTLEVTNRNPSTTTRTMLTGWGLNTKLVNLYYSSAEPNDHSLAMNEVTEGGVQPVAVKSTLPLLIFDLDVALEWDAQQDTEFMRQLEKDLQRASEFLFDWTNGQVALGEITVYHDAKVRATEYPFNPWLYADVRIFATNRLRPSAAKGGVVTEPVTDRVDLRTGSETVTYYPGRVHMGAVWNRFGNANSSEGEEWPRTLAHELGHYLLFLDDNYIGQGDSGLLETVQTCPGAMADHYRADGSLDSGLGEFHPEENWDSDDTCLGTMSEQRTGRSDWATIEAFYPQLETPAEERALAGPRVQPLAITQVRHAPLPDDERSNPLELPYFYVSEQIADGRSGQQSDKNQATQTGENPSAGQASEDSGNSQALANPRNVRAFLHTGDGNWLTDLGRPDGNLIAARGAKLYTAGTSGPQQPPDPDVLCAYRSTDGYFDCAPISVAAGDELELQKPSHRLDIEVSPSPVSSITVELTVSQVTEAGLTAPGEETGTLYAQFFSPDFPSPITTTLTMTNGYSSAFTLTVPSLRGYVAVWDGDVASPANATSYAVTDFSLGGSPALQYIWSNAHQYLWSNAQQFLWSNNAAAQQYLLSGAQQYLYSNAQQYLPSGAQQYLLSGAQQYLWSGAQQYVWSGAQQYLWSGAMQYVWSNAPIRSYAPAVTNDGQVMLYSPDQLAAEEGEFVTLQSTVAPPAPPYLTQIGEAYRLSMSGDMELEDASIVMSYVGRDVNPGEEPYLRIFYRADGGQAEWKPLKTTRSTELNQVAAPAEREGLYALMSSVEIPLEPGWNFIGYPIQSPQAITGPLASIPGQYSVLYAYDPGAERWQVAGPVEAAEAGDSNVYQPLDQIHDFFFGNGYLLHVITATWSLTATQPITLHMTDPTPDAGRSESGRLATVGPDASVSLQAPPAAFRVSFTLTEAVHATDPAGFAPVVQAFIDGAKCSAEMPLTRTNGTYTAAILVEAANKEAGACGVGGDNVEFRVARAKGEAGVPCAYGVWDNTKIQAVATAACGSLAQHTVQTGEAWETVAARYGVCVADLRNVNAATGESLMFKVGMVLDIPPPRANCEDASPGE